MRILCLPIDSRPCNTLFIRQLVSWAGAEAVLPRPEEMDVFRTPAPFAGSLAFLERELPRCDKAVISLDHWCFGSLIASRDDRVPEGEALERVEKLRDILSRYPGTPVYMSSVIMRSSISTLSRDDLDAYRAMTDYSVYSDRFARWGLAEDEERMARAKARIPAEVLERVLRVRERNLRVNLAAVDLAAEGRLAALSLLQEDSQVYGLPKKDQRVILERIREKNVQNVFLRNGTDEAGALSAAEALWAGREPLPADILYLGRGDFTAPYEDRPFRENMESACREVGIVPAPGSETVICVCCPEEGEQQEAQEARDSQAFSAYAQTIDRLAGEGRRVYLLDLIAANGGSTALVGRLKKADLLWGYSAWNTASNSMGTLLAQVITDAIRGERNLPYYRERLLDDLAYQSVIRKKLEEKIEALGDDPYNLADQPRAEALLRETFRRELPALWPLAAMPVYEARLPWSRTFEVSVRVEGEDTHEGI